MPTQNQLRRFGAVQSEKSTSCRATVRLRRKKRMQVSACAPWKSSTLKEREAVSVRAAMYASGVKAAAGKRDGSVSVSGLSRASGAQV